MKSHSQDSTKRILWSVRRIIKKHVGNMKGVRVFLFGSRAGRHYTVRSDFDIGIMLVPSKGAAHRMPLQLMSGINEELDELPILQRIELVDFGRVSNEFKQVALQTVVPVYES